jgi:hypothetical protein
MRSIRFSFKNKVVLSNYLTQNFLLFKQQDKCTFKLHGIYITMVFTTVNRRKKNPMVAPTMVSQKVGKLPVH